MLMVLAFLFGFGANYSFADPIPFQNDQYGCTTKEAANRYLKDFKVDIASFGGLELCDAKVGTKLLLNDLTLLEKTEFAPELSQYFIQGIVPKDGYYAWARDQAKSLRRAHENATVVAYNVWGRFTMEDGWQNSTSLGRVGTLIHEARHTKGFAHVACSTGPYAHSRATACDESLTEKGANAVEMEYYARVVLESTNLHPVYKSMARLMAVGRTNFIFNRMPMRTREGLLASNGRRLTLENGAKVVSRALPEGAQDFRLKETSAGAALVNGGEAFSLDLYDDASSQTRKKDDVSYFKMFDIEGVRMPEEPRDAAEIDTAGQRYLLGLSAAGNFFSYNFPQGEWFPPTAAPEGASAVVPTAPNGARGIFVVTASGEVHSFDPSSRAFTQLAGVTWPAGVEAYAFRGADLVALKGGRVVNAANGMDVPTFPEAYTDLVNVPLYDAFDVAP